MLFLLLLCSSTQKKLWFCVCGRSYTVRGRGQLQCKSREEVQRAFRDTFRGQDSLETDVYGGWGGLRGHEKGVLWNMSPTS